MCVGLVFFSFLSLSLLYFYAFARERFSMFGEQIKPLEPQDKSDRRRKKKEGERRKKRGGAARRDESAAEVLSRGEEETEEQGGRGQGKGESELS